MNTLLPEILISIRMAKRNHDLEAQHAHKRGNVPKTYSHHYRAQGLAEAEQIIREAIKKQLSIREAAKTSPNKPKSLNVPVFF
jgi:hypothetical protein